MNLEAKVSALFSGIKFISEHDDAPEPMVKAALESVRAMVDAEIAGLAQGRGERAAVREKRDAERLAAREKALAAASKAA